MSAQAPTVAAIQRVGRVLLNVLVSDNQQVTNLSNDCKQVLQHMAQTGVALHPLAIEEIRNSQALVQSASRVSVAKLHELRQAVGAAAVSSAAMELMVLWSIVYEATKDVLSEKCEELKEATISTAAASVATLKDNTQPIGRLLLLAFSSSMALSAEVSTELQDGVKEMAERTTPLAANLLQELKVHSVAVVNALPKEQLLELQTLCSQSISSEWSEIEHFASHIQMSVNQIADSQLVQVMKTGAVDVYNSPLAKVIVNEGFSNLDKAFTESRESVESSINMMLGGLSVGACTSFLASLPPLLRFEILRDFCQTVSLFFTNLYGTVLDNLDSPFLRQTQALFRMIYDIVAANFSELWSANHEKLIDVGYIVLLVLIMAGYGCYLWFVFFGRHLHKSSDEVRHGHEGTTWAELARTQQTRVKLFTWVITTCLTIYLPLTRLSVEILVATALVGKSASTTASSSSHRIMERYGDHPIWPFLQALAVVLLVTFTLPLPFLLLRAIKENKPTGSLENTTMTYDLDGEQVPFDEKVYTRLVAKDPAQLSCPYRSLYAGFESKWSYYKVFQLTFKVALILPLVAISHIGARGITTALIYSVIVLVTSYGTPFSDPLNDLMEISGKVAALVTCVGGAILAFSSIGTKAQAIIVTIVNLVNIANLVFMIGIFLFGMKQTRRLIKNWLGTLTFSDTVRDIQDAPSASIIPHWDIEKEAKHRVWQAFWRSALLSLKDEKVLQRFNSLEHAVLSFGIQDIKRHWDGQDNEYTAHIRRAARLMLEGVDVFWNDTSGAIDGHLDSKTCFGKMYVKPYPFHCVMVYDDAKDVTIIRDDKLSEFLFMNFSPLVLTKRLLRQKLRALGASAVQIHFPFSRQEQVSVEDGTETTTSTDSEGNTTTSTRTRYTTVEFTCNYTVGVINVGANSKDHAMADGFNLLMTYKDGCGDAVAPHTGRTHHLTNRVATMGPEHVGLTHEMLESLQLQHIFAQTQEHWVPALSALLEQHRAYRQQLMEKHNESNQVLGDGFWYFVYNNPYLPRSVLERYLQNEERNPLLQGLLSSQRGALEFLYKRMNLINSHPAIKFWFVFWEDVFARNGDMTRLKPFRTDLDPLEPTSICYRVMKRVELEVWLNERKLRDKAFSPLTILLFRKTLFHDKLVQLLYEQLQQLAEPNEIAADKKGLALGGSNNRVRPL